MPIIEIKSLPFSKSIDIPTVLKKLNTEAAAVLNMEERHVWSYWEFIESHHYAVGKETSECLTEHTHSPIVKILAFEGKDPGTMEKLIRTTAGVLVRELEIDTGNIFIYYQEVTSGKVYDGGQIIRKK
ncbi:MAG: hypothetical protein IT281_07490 [Ignavibacteria bacterium]|nr:hypothetical protein [Ignavibacteria bacterium]MCC7159366.1 hypothetical protein [Ignavibacteria bacterium]